MLQSTKTVSRRQPAYVRQPFTLDLARRRSAHFNTAVCQIWAISEQTFDPDPEYPGLVSARLTVVMQFKNRYIGNDTEEIKPIIRTELKKFMGGNGQWSQGTTPDILSCDDPTIDDWKALRISPTQWVVTIDLSGIDTYEPPDNFRY